MKKTILKIAFLFFVLASVPLTGMAITNYIDPTGAPASWPDGSWQQYTADGVGSVDPDSSADNSHGGTSPNPSLIDIVGDVTNGSIYYSYDSSNDVVFFRIHIGDSPLATTGASEPFKSYTWTILLDTDGDGFKEFAIMIDGTGDGTEPDDILVFYNNNPDQLLDPAIDIIWRQDTAFGADDGVDGETGNSAAWDLDTDPLINDYGRTRASELADTTYFLDVQIPMSALDARPYGGDLITGSTPLTIAVSTGASNQDPAQKDFVYAGDYTGCDTCPLPSGDTITYADGVLDRPIITDVSADGCSAGAPYTTTISSTIIDNTYVDTVDGFLKTTVQTVQVYYYDDTNLNGLDDDGNSWTSLGAASLDTGSGVYINPWTYTWDINALANGTSWLLKTIATDNDSPAYVTDSTDTSSISINYNPATQGVTPVYDQFIRNCGTSAYAVSGYVYNDLSQDGFKDVSESGTGETIYVKLCSGVSYQSSATVDPATGYYIFPSVTNGTYDLIEDATNTADCTTKDDPTGWTSSTPATNTLTVVVSGADLTNNNFGDYALGYTVRGYLYDDSNHNGTMDGTEAGIGTSVTIKLCDSVSALSQTTTADAVTGYYEFLLVQDGDYTLYEDFSNTADCTTMTDNTGWISTTPNSLAITVSGKALSGNLFGDYYGSKISGTVFNDKGDGSAASADANNTIYDASESPIAGISMSLCLDTNCSSVVETTVTNTSGDYTLWVPGTTVSDATTVYVIETDKNGYLSTGDSIGGVADSTTTATTANRNTLSYVMAKGNEIIDYDFGDVQSLLMAAPSSFLMNPNDSLTFSHTINVNTPGILSLLLSTTNAFTYLVFDDATCDNTIDGDAITPVGGFYGLNGGTSVATGTRCIILKLTIPSDTGDNTVENLTLMLYENWLNSPDTVGTPNADTGTTNDNSVTLSDIITISTSLNGKLTLTKEVRNITQAGSFVTANTAELCDELEYKINFKNIGINPLNNIILTDNIPLNTIFVEDKYSGLTEDIELVYNASSYFGGINEGPDTDGVTLTEGILSLNIFTIIAPVTELLSGETGYFLYRATVDCP